MKTKLIFAGAIALASVSNSQVTWSGSTPGIGYTSGTVRIGGSTNPGAGTTFHVGGGSGTLHFTGTGSGGMLIKPASGDRALLELHDPSGINKVVLQSLNYGTFFGSLGASPLFLNTSGGDVGVNTLSPGHKLDVHSSVSEDGVSIRQTNAGAAALHMYNNSAGGQHWALFSTGNGNSQGSGNFSIYQYGATDRLFINGTTGDVGIGTNLPDGRLHVKTQYTNVQSINVPRQSGLFEVSATQWGTYHGLRGKVNSTYAGPVSLNYGVTGEATAVMGNDTRTYGVYGHGTGGNVNTGGSFEAIGNNNSLNVGVYAVASGAALSWNNWAAYLDGNVNITGDLYNNVTYIFSDKRFKKEIEPLADVCAKIEKLSGYTYKYKTEEFKEKSFDTKSHIGLMAQEIKEVFPELISEDDKGFYAVNYQGMIPVLLEAVKEQIKLNKGLNTSLEEQQRQLNEQKQLISELSQKSSNATGINNFNPIETGFQMSQNEPNPFTHETVVKYTLPQTVSNAFMAVYDLTGKQITTFPIDQKGSSSITLTSEKLAAGIYIYSIVADGKVVDSKRMIVAEK